MNEKPSPPVLKMIDLSTEIFHANGRTYFIQDSLSVNRYEIFLKMQPELGFNTTFNKMAESFNRIVELMSDNVVTGGVIKEVIEIGVNQVSAIKHFDENRAPLMLYFCTLFCNHQDEDLAVWDRRLAHLKIEDWRKEGIAIQNFFLLAQKSLAGFSQNYQHQLAELSGLHREMIAIQKAPIDIDSPNPG